MKLKKIVAMVMATAMVGSLAACSSGSSTAETTTAAPAPAETEASKEEAEATEAPAEEAAPSADAVWPKDTVQFTVPASPGGGTDIASRIVADYMQRTTGQAFTVVNDTTGGNTVAVENCADAASDGSELMFFHVSTLMSYYQGKITVNPLEDLTIICSIGCQEPGWLVVPAEAEYNTGEEFIEYCKANPKSVTAGVTMGGNSQAIIQCFADDVGIELNYVDAGNEADWITAMMSGSIDACILSPSTAVQYIEAGTFKPIVIAAAERSEAYPDVESFADLGSDVNWVNEFFLYGPKDMDEGVVDAICDAVVAMGDDEGVKESFAEANNILNCLGHDEAVERFANYAATAKVMSEAMGYDVSGK